MMKFYREIAPYLSIAIDTMFVVYTAGAVALSIVSPWFLLVLPLWLAFLFDDLRRVDKRHKA